MLEERQFKRACALAAARRAEREALPVRDLQQEKARRANRRFHASKALKVGRAAMTHRQARVAGVAGIRVIARRMDRAARMFQVERSMRREQLRARIAERAEARQLMAEAGLYPNDAS